jgi:hypothetical protein
VWQAIVASRRLRRVRSVAAQVGAPSGGARTLTVPRVRRGCCRPDVPRARELPARAGLRVTDASGGDSQPEGRRHLPQLLQWRLFSARHHGRQSTHIPRLLQATVPRPKLGQWLRTRAISNPRSDRHLEYRQDHPTDGWGLPNRLPYLRPIARGRPWSARRAHGLHRLAVRAPGRLAPDGSPCDHRNPPARRCPSQP